MEKAVVTINENYSGTFQWSDNPSVDEFDGMTADAENFFCGPRLNRYSGPWPLVSEISPDDEEKISIHGNGVLSYE